MSMANARGDEIVLPFHLRRFAAMADKPHLRTFIGYGACICRDMPIYEYECEICTHRFEQLVLPAQARSAVDRTCPSCRSDHVRQLPSLFAVDSESTRLMNKNQGRRLARKDITEQKHAEMQAIIHHHSEHEH